MNKEMLQAIIFAQLMVHGSCNAETAFQRAGALTEFYFKELSKASIDTARDA